MEAQNYTRSVKHTHTHTTSVASGLLYTHLAAAPSNSASSLGLSVPNERGQGKKIKPEDPGQEIPAHQTLSINGVLELAGTAGESIPSQLQAPWSQG